MTTSSKPSMAWDIVSTVMNKVSDQTSDERRPSSEAQHQLFLRSRLRLALWYAGVMGTILALLGLGVYKAIAHAHEVTIDREIKSVADAIHDAIEATVSTPQQLSQVPPQLLPDLCLSDESCTGPISGPPHRLQRTYQYDYYIRIVDSEGKVSWQRAVFDRKVYPLPHRLHPGSLYKISKVKIITK